MLSKQRRVEPESDERRLFPYYGYVVYKDSLLSNHGTHMRVVLGRTRVRCRLHRAKRSNNLEALHSRYAAEEGYGIPI